MENTPVDLVVRPGDSVLALPSLICPRCRSAGMRLGARGLVLPYRSMGALRIPEFVRVPACSRCKHRWLDAEAEAELKGVLPDAFRRALKARFAELLDVLVPQHTSQRRLEQLLDLSQGYLSRLYRGAGVPSAQLVGHLALIAADPPRRLEELYRYWNVERR